MDLDAARRRTPRRLLGARRAGAVAVAAVALLAGCEGSGTALPEPSLSPSPVDPGGSSPGGEATDAALAEFYGQQVEWHPCEAEECTEIEVPLDYAAPDGERISLSVLRVPARKESQRVGSLVVNPGGPGGSGVDYAAQASTYFGPEILQAFDVVGFDPRGVGRSAPVDCVSDERLDVFVAADPDPDTPAEVRRAAALLAELGRGCVQRSGDLAAHVSTEEAARDLDVLRAVLGDRRLSYFGASYGTFLGATYADLFPHRVGRMVLDGALDPSVSTLELSLTQARGFETALRAYVGACVRRGDCFLGADVAAGTRRVRELLDAVERAPLPAGDRRLRIGNAVLGVWAPLYNREYWPILDNALRAALAGDGTYLLGLSDAYTSRGPRGYHNNALEALYAVNCLDRDDPVPVEQVPEQLPRFQRASPTFGAIFAWSLASCESWPIRSGRVPAPVTAAGAAPILVVGTTRDPATPLRWAESLADQLDSGVLVRRAGDGHTGYRAGNPCVDATVESYLVSGRVPEGTVDC